MSSINSGSYEAIGNPQMAPYFPFMERLAAVRDFQAGKVAMSFQQFSAIMSSFTPPELFMARMQLSQDRQLQKMTNMNSDELMKMEAARLTYIKNRIEARTTPPLDNERESEVQFLVYQSITMYTELVDKLFQNMGMPFKG